jgi:uncharacterized RDD family membrane protein YckC
MKKETPSYLSKHDLYHKGNPARMMRVIAKGIDLMIAFLIAFVLYPWGILIGVMFLSIIDAANNGESIGKKMMGFRVISLKDGSPCDIRSSFIRNLPITIPLFFMIIPVLGWLFFLFLIIPMVAMELYLIFKLDSFHRLGDVLADTTVVANDPYREDLRKKQKDWAAQPGDIFTRSQNGNGQ